MYEYWYMQKKMQAWRQCKTMLHMHGQAHSTQKSKDIYADLERDGETRFRK